METTMETQRLTTVFYRPSAARLIQKLELERHGQQWGDGGDKPIAGDFCEMENRILLSSDHQTACGICFKALTIASEGSLGTRRHWIRGDRWRWEA